MAEPDLWDEKALVNIYDTANTVNLNIAAMTELLWITVYLNKIRKFHMILA